MQRKIKNKLNKFRIIKINGQKEGVIWIGGQRAHYNSEVTILRLRLNTLGFNKHADYRNNIARRIQQTLYRFRNIPKTKIY